MNEILYFGSGNTEYFQTLQSEPGVSVSHRPASTPTRRVPMQTSRKLVLNRETVRRLGAAERNPGGGSANDSCWQTLCTTESGCQVTVKD